MCALALLMCASHTSFELRRRGRHYWNSCINGGGEDPVIHIHNEGAVVSTHEKQLEDDSSIWKKNILMGGKCELPDFSGVIIYDSNGNIIVTPPKNSRPLLTWK
ncbi:putative transmembrane protein [Senna tora]|uniref:Putative transmembrane protein n=1 Tax=Senna tora TaxID=362788 RepID=A0A834TEL8_9FABA|nr:putative transmembrane protein [Senna tora]